LITTLLLSIITIWNDLTDEQIGFTFAGRTIDYFGSKAITSDHTALFELIKNSRDANASKVTISFQDIGTDNARIEVYDDGDGMSRNDIKDKWFVIGTDSRQLNQKTKKGKQVWGEMGIGRLACQKLGKVTSLISVKQNKKIVVDFDWRRFEKPSITVDKIKFSMPPDRAAGGEEHGVTLELQKLNSKWTTKKIRDFMEEISLLISQDNINEISVMVKTGRGTPEHVGKDYSKLWEHVINNAPFKANVRFDGENLDVKFMTQVGKKGSWEDQDVTDVYDDTEVGPFTADIYHFPRAPGKAKTATIEQYYEAKISVDRLESFVKDKYGLFLYRDGVWMKPYGGNTDWLGLEAAARQETQKIGLKQIYGTVNMTKKKNSGIKPASHRETLIENEAYGDLKRIMGDVFEMLRHYMRDWKKEQERKELKEMGADDGEDLDLTIDQVLKKIKNISRKLPKDEKEEFERYFGGYTKTSRMRDEGRQREITEMGEMRDWEKNLATLGIASSFMAREVTEALQHNMEISKEAEEMMAEQEEKGWDISEADKQRGYEMVETLKKNQAKMGHFMGFVGVFSDHLAKSIRNKKRATQVNVLKCWNTVTDAFEDIKEELDITIMEDYDELVVKMDTIDLESVLTHLYMNSIRSLERTKGRKRKVEFDYKYKEGGLTIEFSDNGIGIPVKKLKEVFEPFKFGHNEDDEEKHGHGLGLHIVKRIMDSYGGTAEAVPHSPGAMIIIRFPDMKKVAA
jgi:two-component sensor histidine kinase